MAPRRISTLELLFMQYITQFYYKCPVYTADQIKVLLRLWTAIDEA